MTGVGLSINYPCYVLLDDAGAAECVVSGAKKCLCVFSELKRLEAYYSAKHGGDFVSRDVGTMCFDDRQALTNFLRREEPKLTAQGVAHVALNAVPGGSTPAVPIPEFIKGLEQAG